MRSRRAGDEGAGEVTGARRPELTELLAGLRADQKEIAPKYFYDERGSQLFEEITRLPEYYQTRTERALLERWMPVWVAEAPPAELVELGAGSAEKSRVILDEMVGHTERPTYVPVDVSARFLRQTADRLRAEYEQLEVVPAVADISRPLDIDIALREPTWFAFIGGTIGNFGPVAATRLLRGVSRRMRAADRFLLGVDLRPGPLKPVAVVEAAYNDAAGVTADFNRNALRTINARFGANFAPEAFEHHAYYDEEFHRIEMHLRSLASQTVRIAGEASIHFPAGETLRTEISCKHDRDSVDALLDGAGLCVERWVDDGEGRFAIFLARTA